MQGGFAKKRGNTWTAYFYTTDLNGKRVQRTKAGFHTKREAQAHLTQVLSAVQTGDFVQPVKLTVEQYLMHRWLPIMEASLQPSTFDSYTRVIQLHVLPRLGHLPLQELSVDHLDRLYGDLRKGGRHDGKEGGLSAKSIRYIHTTLHKALKDAERKRLVIRNVASAADPPRLRSAGDNGIQTWSAEDVRRFLDAMADHRLGAAFFVSAMTGMRRGEVLGLRWNDVDLDAGLLKVRNTITSVNYRIVEGPPKTARSRRTFNLDPKTLSMLREHLARQDADKEMVGTGYTDADFVFAKPDGSPIHPDYYSQLFDRSVKKFGLPKIRLHDLRHTYATINFMGGIAPKVVSDRLGHATIGFTLDVYTHHVDALDKAAAQQMADTIFPEPPADDGSEENGSAEGQESA